MKRYNLGLDVGYQNILNDIEFDRKNKSIVEYGKIVKKRTSAQNRALWKWNEQILNLVTEYGVTYTKTDFLGTFEFMHTKESIHSMFLLILKNLYGYKSSTEMKTNDFEQLIDVMTMHLVKYGILVKFPSAKDMIEEEERLIKMFEK